MTDFGKRAGDMLKSVYDTDADGTVDDSSKLQASSKSQVQDHTPKTHNHTESQISDLDHNALKVKGVLINDAAKADQKVLAYDSGSDRIIYISQAPSGATIKNIQFATITIPLNEKTATATITAVVMANTVVVLGGQFLTDTTSHYAIVTLTNTTTVTAVCPSDAVAPVVFKLTVVEFDDATITGVQRGTIYLPAATGSNTATITAVDLTKSVLFLLGMNASGSWNDMACHIQLTDSTTVTATRQVTNGNTTVGFEVLEFL